jgi:hypothetical protein
MRLTLAECPPKNLPTYRHHTFIKLLNKQLSTRNPIAPARPKRLPKGSRSLFVVPYTHPILNLIPFEALFTSSSLARTLPPHLQDTLSETSPIVSFSTGRTLGSHLFNYTDLRHLSFEELTTLSKAPCSCHLPTSLPFVDPSTGHVCTNNLALIPDPTLRQFMSLGTKLRFTPESATDPSAVLGPISLALNGYLNKVSLKTRTARKEFDEWEVAFMETVATHITRHEHTNYPRTVPPLSKSCQSSIKSLQDPYIFCPTDKSSQDFSLYCKPFYVSNLLRELNANGTYTHIPALTTDTLLNKNRALVKSLSIPFVPEDYNVIAYFYNSLKAHKDPIGHRYIAASHKSPLAPLSLHLNHALDALRDPIDHLQSDTLHRWTRIIVILDPPQTRHATLHPQAR